MLSLYLVSGRAAAELVTLSLVSGRRRSSPLSLVSGRAAAKESFDCREHRFRLLMRPVGRHGFSQSTANENVDDNEKDEDEVEEDSEEELTRQTPNPTEIAIQTRNSTDP